MSAETNYNEYMETILQTIQIPSVDEEDEEIIFQYSLYLTPEELTKCLEHLRNVFNYSITERNIAIGRILIDNGADVSALLNTVDLDHGLKLSSTIKMWNNGLIPNSDRIYELNILNNAYKYIQEYNKQLHIRQRNMIA